MYTEREVFSVRNRRFPQLNHRRASGAAIASKLPRGDVIMERV